MKDVNTVQFMQNPALDPRSAADSAPPPDERVALVNIRRIKAGQMPLLVVVAWCSRPCRQT